MRDPLPIAFNLDEMEVDLHNGHTATGTGRVELLTPFGPTFWIDGEPSCEWGQTMSALRGDGRGPPGRLHRPPDRKVRGRNPEYEVEGQPIMGGPSLCLENERLRVDGDIRTWTADVRRRGTKPTPVARIDVHYLGRRAGGFPFPRLPERLGGIDKGLVLPIEEHTFVLPTAVSHHQVRERVKWSSTGRFAYIGPLGIKDEEFGKLLDRFAVVLGNTLGTPVDPVTFVEVGDRGRDLGVRWLSPSKPYRGAVPTHPVGPILERVEGTLRSSGTVQDIADWLPALYREVEAWEQDGYDLDLLLRYIETSSSRPMPEMQCRDLIIALEGIAGAFAEQRGLQRSSKLGTLLATLRNKTGLPISQDEATVLQLFRRRLSHRGDLKATRLFDLAEHQELALAEGWLTTCCYRLLAHILDVNVQIADMADERYPRRRPSEGGFVLPPFVPTDK